MGRKIFSACVVAIFALSLFYFLQYSSSSAEPTVEGAQSRTPVISIEGLILWKYKDERINWKLTSQSAVFITPDQLELRGKIRYEKPSPEKYELLSCEKAQLMFDADGLLAIKDDSQLKEVLVEDDVRMHTGEYTISTKSARYRLAESTISSVDPVEVRSTVQKFDGTEGFLYDTKKGSLTMNGDIRGEIVR